MKIRNGFVSNSSSTSFCIYGTDITDVLEEKDYTKEEYVQLFKSLNLEIPSYIDEYSDDTIFESCDVKDSNDGFSNYRLNRIQMYKIELLKDNEWKSIYVSDEPMGDCKVIRFPKEYTGEQIRLKIMKALAPPSIFEFNVINEH